MDMVPLNYDAIAWMVKQINTHLSASGFVVGIAVDKNNTVLAARVLPTGVAIENGFIPVEVVTPQNPEPPKKANV